MQKAEELILPSRLESVDEAASAVERFARASGVDENFISAIDLAVRESVANAVKHGNNLDAAKKVVVRFTRLRKGFEITVRDHGNGFLPNEVPDPTDAEHILMSSGRGILFMRSFMDSVEWLDHPDGGTIVKMIKMF